MIKIVTDSTAYFNNGQADELGVSVVPLYVKSGDTSYKERVEISDDEFYKRLKEGEQFETSQPSPHDFLKVYEKILNDGNEILSLHISSKLSGTVNSANIAREILATDKITVIDSEFSSIPLLYTVLKAKELSLKNLSRNEIVDEISSFKKRIYGFFLPFDIDYLARGGRVSHLQHALSNKLKLYFTAHLHKGKIELYKISRTKKHSIDELIQIALNYIKHGNEVEAIDIAYGANIEEGESFRNKLEETLKLNIHSYRIGPVLGSHLGPEFLGIGIITKREV